MNTLGRLYVSIVSFFIRALVRRADRSGRYVTFTHDGRPYMRRFCVFGHLTGDVRRESLPHGFKRLWVRIRSELPNLYVHQIIAPDHDPSLHDHPWPWAVSWVMLGGYRESRLYKGTDPREGFYERTLTAPALNFLSGRTFHRVSNLPRKYDISKGFVVPSRMFGVWTLFLAGPRASRKPWGYLVPGRGYVPHTERHAEIGGEEVRGSGRTLTLWDQMIGRTNRKGQSHV
jgi:hypothetical protein